ncbi:unnamed protein product [Dicrocoelium dendriticum]|nr:unnamed protein product [Dicrocoelium dendriticum]
MDIIMDKASDDCVENVYKWTMTCRMELDFQLLCPTNSFEPLNEFGHVVHDANHQRNLILVERYVVSTGNYWN